MAEYLIKRADPADVISALELAKRVFMKYEAPIYSKSAIKEFIGGCTDNPDYISKYTSGRHLMFIALDGSRIVGMVCERGGGRISMLFVESEYHRRGIATALLNRIIPFMKQSGAGKITLHASPYGLEFYKKYGFYATGCERFINGFIVTPMEYEVGELWDIYDRDRNKTGYLIERGKHLARDEYHILVHVWIRNKNGKWLISKRSPNKHYPNMWECTGGSALTGENSFEAALREAGEELGVRLDTAKGQLFKSYIKDYPDHTQHVDVWVFTHDCPVEDIVLQDGETCDAMWASTEKIKEMIARGEFLGYDIYPYLDELFAIRDTTDAGKYQKD